MVLLKKKAAARKENTKKVVEEEVVEDVEMNESTDEEDESAFEISDHEDEQKDSQPAGSESEEEDDNPDYDRELQIALKDGLLKSDRLNYIVPKKMEFIYKKNEIVDKINSFAKKLPWIETLDITTKNTLTKDMINNDFERELQFYKQAEKAVQIAVPRLLNSHIKVMRPEDYYAEMSKTDGHMQRVRKRLLKIQEGKERQESIRRMREEKKYASKVQKKAIENKNAEKKRLTEAVKKHKKGMKGQLEDMLNNVKRFGLDDSEGFERPSSRGKVGGGPAGKFAGRPSNRDSNRSKEEFKSQRFGFGGRKKGSKRNTKESFEDYDGKSFGRSSFGGSGGRGGRGRGGRGGGGRGGGRGRGGRR